MSADGLRRSSRLSARETNREPTTGLRSGEDENLSSDDLSRKRSREDENLSSDDLSRKRPREDENLSWDDLSRVSSDDDDEVIRPGRLRRVRRLETSSEDSEEEEVENPSRTKVYSKRRYRMQVNHENLRDDRHGVQERLNRALAIIRHVNKRFQGLSFRLF